MVEKSKVPYNKDELPPDQIWFSDLPDCEDKDLEIITLQTLLSNSEASPVKIAMLMAKMMICITRMRREIKKLKTMDAGNISRN